MERFVEVGKEQFEALVAEYGEAEKVVGLRDKERGVIVCYQQNDHYYVRDEASR